MLKPPHASLPQSRAGNRCEDGSYPDVRLLKAERRDFSVRPGHPPEGRDWSDHVRRTASHAFSGPSDRHAESHIGGKSRPGRGRSGATQV
ncbi:hypothetical protein HFQ13_07580 [Acidithiobacillus sp. VAN18-1]|uniref:Uncharacterized protein n=1 Tax=Igneacidithiobacillus copahuensis TaxID=2724909 RepID=A0AAE2YQG1_9PROT|nr:hypothetical protein [Igneacidithiobacillus copahuensis]